MHHALSRISRRRHRLTRQLSSTAAKKFVDAYYDGLNRRRPSTTLPAFYISSTKAYAAHSPDISINGLHMTSPDEFAKLLEDNYLEDPKAPPQNPRGGGPGGGNDSQVRYELEAFDAHVINPDFNLAAPPDVMASPDKTGAKCSILTQVTGRVYYGRGRNAPAKTFNEVFVLVPNWDAFERNAPKMAKRWLIMSQNFRAL